MTKIDTLIEMSRRLGRPEEGLVILGEGNTSCRIDEDTFAVKASGRSLPDMTQDSLITCRFQPLLDAMNSSAAGDDVAKAALEASRVGDTGAMPSTEAFFHAYLLTLPDVNFVGHTHPITVNGFLCSEKSDLLALRLFPDHIVCCGPTPCFVPYTDPGLVLARALRDAVEKFIRNEGVPPRCILMESHGLIAIGPRPEEVLSCTFMAEKAAKILHVAQSAGGARPFSQENIERIHMRPDEAYRRALIGRMKG
jgi:rhamnose utilization protein RhaD (predicted bifunctional aldolase and dehydrogenase)